MSIYETYLMIKQAVASEQEILNAAVKYYNNEDPEDPKRRWDHVLDTIEVAKKIRGRKLTPVELGILAFHDSGYNSPNGYYWGIKNHPRLSSKILRKEAPGLGYTPEEIKRMAKVISYHMRTPKKNSPLLKDDLQMLMFGADEGTPISPSEDAKKYFKKALVGRYPEVPAYDDPKFIDKLVARVRTFHDYSNAPGLAYYHQVYPNYHKDLYNYWHSDQLEKDYRKLLKEKTASIEIDKQKQIEARKFIDEVKKLALKKNLNFFLVTDGASGISNRGNPAVRNAREAQIKWELENGYNPYDDWGRNKDKYSIHGAILGCLGKHAKDFDYNISEKLPNDPWKAIINTKPMSIDKVRQFHKYHNVDVDNAGVPYYFLTRNERTGDKAVWFSDSPTPLPINNKQEISYAKQVGLDKGLVPEQLDFKF